MLLPASIRVPFRNDVCGIEAQPLTPARAIGADVPEKSAVAMACSAIVLREYHLIQGRHLWLIYTPAAAVIKPGRSSTRAYVVRRAKPSMPPNTRRWGNSTTPSPRNWRKHWKSDAQRLCRSVHDVPRQPEAEAEPRF